MTLMSDNVFYSQHDKVPLISTIFNRFVVFYCHITNAHHLHPRSWSDSGICRRRYNSHVCSMQVLGVSQKLIISHKQLRILSGVTEKSCAALPMVRIPPSPLASSASAVLPSSLRSCHFPLVIRAGISRPCRPSCPSLRCRNLRRVCRFAPARG